MMLYQLIPFFLATQLETSNNTWKYGPEYNFSGHVKMITSLEQDKGVPKGTGLYFGLKCRPQEPNALRCHIANSKIIRIKPQAFDVYLAEPDTDDTYRNINILRAPFDIKFNDRGIDSYVFEKTNPPVSPWSTNEIRVMVNQLSIGIDLSDEMRSTHKGRENFTIGECDVDFQITRRPVTQSGKNTKQFELSPLEKLGKFADESITVVKRRDVNECLRCAEPFFGTRYTLGLLLRNVLTKLKKSESKIFISKYELTSETINESEVYGQNRDKLGKVMDYMKLTLDSVTAANGELSKISDSITVHVLTDMNDNDDINVDNAS